MDAVLEQALKLAYLIRDSEEAKSWRKAWNSLSDIPFSTPNPASLSVEEITLADQVLMLRKDGLVQCRPLLFLLLIQEIIPYLNAAEIKKQLKLYLSVWHAYQRLTSSLALIGQLVAFLRSIGPGYPHSGLVYTLSNAPWAQLIRMKELPWGMGESLLFGNSTDASYIGLERFIPSVSQQLATSLNALVVAIKADSTWLKLEASYEKIARERNLNQAINETRNQFEKEFGNINRTNIPPAIWRAKVEELARKVYLNRGPRIQVYVESFLEYEKLIERIYWLISQLIIYESISCLTSSDSKQLQQVSLGYGKEVRLTALVQSLAKTLQVGQLVHIELIETDHVLDGLYQVEEWYETYQAGTDARALFRARCLWYCQLQSLLDVTREFTDPSFVPSETVNMWGEGSRMDITGPDGKVDTLSIRDVVPQLEIRKTMYLI